MNYYWVYNARYGSTDCDVFHNVVLGTRDFLVLQKGLGKEIRYLYYPYLGYFSKTRYPI